MVRNMFDVDAALVPKILQIRTRREAYPLLLPPDSIGAELGVMIGENARDLLDAQKTKQLFLVDDWSNPFCNRGTVENLIAGRGDVSIVTGDAASWLASLDEGALDWAYLDTTHWIENTVRELPAMIHAVKPGGVIATHDFCINDAWEGGIVVPFLEAISRGLLAPLAVTLDAFPSLFCRRL